MTIAKSDIWSHSIIEEITSSPANYLCKGSPHEYPNIDAMYKLIIPQGHRLVPQTRCSIHSPPSTISTSCQVHRRKDGVEVVSQSGKATITYDPFQVEFSVNGEIAVLLNSRGLFNFEYYRKKRCSH